MAAGRVQKADGAWDAQFKGYEYFYFPMDHEEFADSGVIGNPMRATAEKGDEIFDRFAGYLAEALEALRRVPVEIKSRRSSTRRQDPRSDRRKTG